MTQSCVSVQLIAHDWIRYEDYSVILILINYNINYISIKRRIVTTVYDCDVTKTLLPENFGRDDFGLGVNSWVSFFSVRTLVRNYWTVVVKTVSKIANHEYDNFGVCQFITLIAIRYDTTYEMLY